MCKAGDITFANIDGAIIKAIIVKKDGNKIYITNFDKQDNKIYEINKDDIIMITKETKDISNIIITLFFVICFLVMIVSLLVLYNLRDVTPLY